MLLQIVQTNVTPELEPNQTQTHTTHTMSWLHTWALTTHPLTIITELVVTVT